MFDTNIDILEKKPKCHKTETEVFDKTQNKKHALAVNMNMSPNVQREAFSYISIFICYFANGSLSQGR